MGLFDSAPAYAWATLAKTLGLTAYVPTASYAYGTSFRQMKRALGLPAHGPPSFQHSLYGTRNGIEVIVLTYDVGSGSSSRTYTGFIARIDPPLFLGLGVRPHGFFENIFGAADLNVGDKEADAKLNITSFDPEQTLALLSPNDAAGRDLLNGTIQLASLTPRITDSLVMLSEEGTISHPKEVGRLLDAACSLASRYAARRQTMPLTRKERALHRDWRAFAERERFQFDAPRMKLEGSIAGSAMEIGLETEGEVVRTSVSVRFPRAVDVVFAVLRSKLPGFLQGIFSQDIKVGDPSFDDMFSVTGYPEAAIREVLGKPELTALLVHLGHTSQEILLNEHQLYFSRPNAVVTGDELYALAEAGRTATEALFGGVKNLGPYR